MSEFKANINSTGMIDPVILKVIFGNNVHGSSDFGYKSLNRKRRFKYEIYVYIK